ncbi:MAG: hypothetical protein CMG74_06190 [Candidatus Marinimicrobia bacterium]|nr:hypothetical protein [Candidatus Neomarinimicrobiota bacterium]
MNRLYSILQKNSMNLIYHKYVILISSLLFLSGLTAQTIRDLVGEWTGKESLSSQVEIFDDKDIFINIDEGGDRKGFLIYKSSSSVMYNENLSWAHHYCSYDKEDAQVLFLRRYNTPIGVLGNQEMRYNVVEWTGNSMVLNHISQDGHLTHKIILGRSALGIDNDQPDSFLLKQNYPNPFNPNTEIAVDSETGSIGDLSIYNLKGELVKTIFAGTFRSGRSVYHWNGKDWRGNLVSSGTYIYRLRLNGREVSRKMVLFK